MKRRLRILIDASSGCWFNLQVSGLGVECGIDRGRIDQSGDHTIVASQRQLVVKRLHHSDQGKLGRAVVRHVTEAEQSRAAGDAHNVAMVSAEHRGQELLEDPVAGEQVDAQRRHELVLFALDERLEVLDASVVDDDGDVADIASNALADGSYLLAASEITVIGVDAFAVESARLD